MGRPKKTVEVTDDIEVAPKNALKELPLEETSEENPLLKEVEALRVENEELKKKLSENSLTISDEVKAAMDHIEGWLKFFMRGSSNVDFRQKTKDAIRKLRQII